MKTLIQIALLLFCIGFLNFCFAQKDVTQEKQPIIVIDPGHGGQDSGAISSNGAKEKDIVMSIASKIIVLNQKLYENSLVVFLTRYTDTFVSLGDRSRLAKKLKADVFISLHCNQAINQTARGTEVYIHSESEVQTEESIYLGFMIQKGLADLLGIKNRGLKYGNFQVLRENHNGTAVILLELGFLSQTDEAIYLTQEASQYAIALVILQSIIKSLEL